MARKQTEPPKAKVRPEKKHPFEKGDKVMIVGENGVFRVYDDIPWYDGSISLFGGDKDPNGIRKFRSVMPDKIKADKRKHTTKGV